jgi:hypothetical protein
MLKPLLIELFIDGSIGGVEMTDTLDKWHVTQPLASDAVRLVAT